MLTRQKKCSIDVLKYSMSCFSKKSLVGTSFASLVTVVTIDYEFWRRLNSEIASDEVAVYEQGTAVNLQSQANGNIYVRKSMLCGNSNQFCFWKLYNQIQNFLKNQNLVFLRSKMKTKFSTLCHAWNGLNEVGVIKPTRKTLQAKTVRFELFSRSTHRG